MAGGAGTGQASTPMGGGQSPLSTGGGMSGGQQQPQPMQNPFQPSYMQDPEFMGYQTQARDLSRQMDEYMKKAPMYQQLQDLQGKMAPFQQRFQQQQQQQFNPYQRYQPQPQYGGNQGLQGLMSALQGMRMPYYGPPTQNFGRERTYVNPSVTANYGRMQDFGREQVYTNPSLAANYSRVRSATAPAAPVAASPATLPANGYVPAYPGSASDGWL